AHYPQAVFGGAFGEEIRVVVVVVDHGGGALDTTAEDFRLGAGNAVQAAEAFQVGAGDVGDQRHPGFDQGYGPGDFTGRVGAQFDHRAPVPGPQAQQGERHTDVVVQVAPGGQGVVTEQRGDHLLDGGFAGVAGYRHAR